MAAQGPQVPSVSTPNQLAMPIVNPDGTNIGGAGGTSMLDDATFTPGGSSVTPAGFLADDTSPDPVDEGDIGAARMNATTRAQYVTLLDTSGNEVSVGGGTQYDEDEPHSSGDKLTLAGAVRRDTASSGTSADGDRATINVDGSGRLWVNNSGVTQPISAASLPLPTGASTSALQTTANTALAAMQAVLESLTVLNLAANDPLSVAIVDGDGTQITSFGGGTQYTEGDTDASITGTAMLWEDASDTLRAVSSAKPLPISVASLPLPSGAATSAKQDTVIGHLDGVETLLGTIDADTSTLAGAVSGSEMQVDVVGALPAGNNNIGDVDVASIVPGTGATNLGKAEDGAHSTGDVGVMALAVRQDTPGATSGADGDYEPLQVAGGRLWVDASGKTLTVGSHAVTNAGTFAVQVDGSALTALQLIDNLVLAEDAAHQTGDPGVQVLGVRQSSQADFGADGDYVPLSIDDDGGLRVSIVAGAGSGGTAAADDADFVAGTTSGTPAMGVYESTPTSVTDGDLGTVGITSDRRLKTSATIDAALPAGTNAIGKLAANSGVDIGDVDILSIAAGDNNIGNVDIASIAAGDNNIGNVDILSIAAGDNNIGNVDVVTLPATPAGTNAIGKLLPPDIDVTGHTNYAKKYYTSAGAATDGIIWSPAAGKRWHITTITINVSAACTVTLEDDKAGGDEAIYKAEFAANSGVVLTFPEKYPWASGEDAADLIITTTAGNVYVTAVGYEI